MNLTKGLRPVTEVLAIVVGFLCGFLAFCVFATQVGWYWVRGVLVSLPGVCIGYWVIWLLYWLIEWLILGPDGEPKPLTQPVNVFNHRQQICLWMGIAIFVLIGLFPPWLCVSKGGRLRSAGNAFILSSGYVNVSRLCFQWAVVAVITTGLILTFRDKKPKDE